MRNCSNQPCRRCRASLWHDQLLHPGRQCPAVALLPQLTRQQLWQLRSLDPTSPTRAASRFKGRLAAFRCRFPASQRGSQRVQHRLKVPLMQVQQRQPGLVASLTLHHRLLPAPRPWTL